jgi:hypothetical protein
MNGMAGSVSRLLERACAEPQGTSPWACRSRARADADDPLAAAERLAAATAARLSLSRPLPGGDGPVGTGALLMAAALDHADRPESAVRLARQVGPPVSGADLLARHGLLVGGHREATRDTVLGTVLSERSPLTGLLEHPVPHRAEECGQLLDALLDRPDGRALVIRRFAEPEADPATLLWRARVLDRYRHTAVDRRFVLDVYEAAMLHHGPAHRKSVRAAAAGQAGGPDLAEASARAEWWGPLARLDRTFLGELRARPLLTGYAEGVSLHRGFRRTEGTR